jgi:hypothetical protein
MRRGADGTAESEFLTNLRAGLSQAGFTDVFVDTTTIHGGDRYLSSIHRAVSDCDLFVAVIGEKWLEILREKTARAKDDEDAERDVLVLEVRAALDLDKEILPLLVDGATLPKKGDLPESIQELPSVNKIQVASTDSAERIASNLAASSRHLTLVRKLGSRWLRIYLIFAFFAYYFCAIQPHVVGALEFGIDPWVGMVKVWSGFYVWPIFFLPFALVALYRPLTVLFEAAFNAASQKDRLTYLTPLALGTVIALLAVGIEIIPTEEVPWSIHPTLPQPGCQHGPAAGPPDHVILSSYNRPLPQSPGALDARYANEFWLKSKCWPNVFFYLTKPAYQNAVNEGYSKERAEIQQAFIRVLKIGKPYSASFFPYVLSFSIMIWLAAIGIVLSGFYVFVGIRRPHDDAELKVQNEDAYLCLTYSFVTLMVWMPFRMNTNYFKHLYSCQDVTRCEVAPDRYFYDILLVLMFLIGYILLTGSLLIKYRRLAKCFLGASAITIAVVVAIAVYHLRENVARLTDLWQFYVGVSIPVILLMALLWYQFDPAIVRFNDFKRDANARPKHGSRGGISR